MNYEDLYGEALQQIMALRRQLRAEQVKNVLAKLARIKPKSIHLQCFEEKLQEELQGHNRGERIDLLLEILQDML